MLDEHERRALGTFLHVLEEERFEPKPQVQEAHILRGPEGQIIVPVVLDADELSMSMALLMAHKCRTPVSADRMPVCPGPTSEKGRGRAVFHLGRWGMEAVALIHPSDSVHNAWS